jgi:hypothetical protein
VSLMPSEAQMDRLPSRMEMGAWECSCGSVHPTNRANAREYLV